MGVSQILMVVLMVAGMGGYYWWKAGRHGGAAGYMRHQLGLQPGEEIQALWTAYYDIDRTLGDRVGEVFGARVRGVNILVAITSRNRLAIGSNEKNSPPISFDKGSVQVSLHAETAEIGSLAGPNGLERAQVGLLTPTRGGAPFRIQIAASGLQALQAWAA
jgi:hypothetical protein